MSTERLRNLIGRATARKATILGVLAASGQVTVCAVDAGADVLLAMNFGPARMLGLGSLAAFLPYGNANQQTELLLREHILPRAQGVPVVAGVLGSDPTVDLPALLGRLRELNVAGIVNCPPVGYFDGKYRQALDESGLGIDSEIALLRQAQEFGFVTFGFCHNADDARRFALAEVDALILTLGVTRRVEDVHERRERLHRAIVQLNGMLGAVAQAKGRQVCLAFGGPVTAPEDLEELVRHCAIHGFAGGPVFDSLPVRSIVTSTVRRFKSIVSLKGQYSNESGLEQIIGGSSAMREVFQRIRQVAPHDVNVCLEGESGTGKELVATHIHRLSHRFGHAFITLNCGAVLETLLESELFGHEKGAFTGADRRRLGKFELAHQGTLFLDEIADLSLHGQVALLRAIQQREISRIGGETPVPADVRIIAASNQNLSDLVSQGRFRADLFYRLSNVTVSIPPLRERKNDIPLLVEDLLTRLQIQLNRKLLGIAPEFSEKLQQHAWPGNVRELQHVISQAALFEDGPVLKGDHFLPVARSDRQARSPAKTAIRAGLRRSRQTTARQALANARGNKSLAARALGIARKTLYEWLSEPD